MKASVRIVFILMAAFSLSVYGQQSRVSRPDDTSSSRPPGRVGGGSVSLDGTFSLAWETRLEPPEPALDRGFETRTIGGASAFHRIMLDRARRTYFGYDITVEKISEVGGYRVSFSPFVMTPEITLRLLLDGPSEWKPMPQPRFPGPMTVQSGDRVLLDVLVNPATGQKIVDYVTVQDPFQGGRGQ